MTHHSGFHACTCPFTVRQGQFAHQTRLPELTGCALNEPTRVDLTEATVKRHLRNVFIKLDAVNKAIALSLITSPKQARSGVVRPARTAGR